MNLSYELVTGNGIGYAIQLCVTQLRNTINYKQQHTRGEEWERDGKGGETEIEISKFKLIKWVRPFAVCRRVHRVLSVTVKSRFIIVCCDTVRTTDDSHRCHCTPTNSDNIRGGELSCHSIISHSDSVHIDFPPSFVCVCVCCVRGLFVDTFHPIRAIFGCIRIEVGA